MGISFSAVDHNSSMQEVTFDDGRTATFPEMLRLPGEWDLFSLANANARQLFGLLGIEFDCCGEIGLPEARRAVMVARATFARRAGGFTREPVSEPKGRGMRLVREGNVVRIEQDGPAFFEGGIDEDYLASRLNHFAAFVEAAAEAGATGITWG